MTSFVCILLIMRILTLTHETMQQDSFVVKGSGKRSFILIEGKRHEISDFHIKAYGWSLLKIPDKLLLSYPESYNFQVWREVNHHRRNIEISDKNLTSILKNTFAKKWNGKEIDYNLNIFPNKINNDWSNLIHEACPLFVLIDTGANGFGDQTERLIYALYIAKMLKATLVVDGYKGYQPALKLLGIDLNPSPFYIYENYNPVDITLSYYEVLKLKSQLLDGKKVLACNTVIHSHPWSCRKNYHHWCTSLKEYTGFEEVRPILLNLNASESCKRMKLGFKKRINKNNLMIGDDSSQINILWHIRNGDICVNCDNTEYFKRISNLLENSLGFKEGSLGKFKEIRGHNGVKKKVNLIFESVDKLSDKITTHFSLASFSSRDNFLGTICKMMTSDILVTSGSSLTPLISLFTKPWAPVVFEERKKWIEDKANIKLHYLSNISAVLLNHGSPFLESNLLEQIMKNKFF